MNRIFSDYAHCVEKLRIMAGIRSSRTKSIREALLDNSFHDTIKEAGHCRLMDHWPLGEQRDFLESLTGLNEMQKRVRIHEMAYSLYKAEKYAFNLV